MNREESAAKNNQRGGSLSRKFHRQLGAETVAGRWHCWQALCFPDLLRLSWEEGRPRFYRPKVPHGYDLERPAGRIIPEQRAASRGFPVLPAGTQGASFAGVFGDPLKSSSIDPGEKMIACGRKSLSNRAKRCASSRLTNRPPRAPDWSRTTQHPRRFLPMKRRGDRDGGSHVFSELSGLSETS
jgi:hypothetical protein